MFVFFIVCWGNHVTDLPAKKKKKKENAWFSDSSKDYRREKSNTAAASKREGTHFSLNKRHYMSWKALFTSIMNDGVLYHSKHLSFKWKSSTETKVFVVVSKKTISSAVLRNKLKRRIRMLFSSEAKNSPISGIFFTKAGINTLSFTQLKEEVCFLLQKIKKHS